MAYNYLFNVFKSSLEFYRLSNYIYFIIYLSINTNLIDFD